jgi:alpha,alpha-trehalase
MYPWQSGSDGSEESQRLHLNPLAGRWTSDVSHLQRHVCHAVAYPAWQYYEATGDLAFLVDHGAEMILEIARFWSSAANYDRGRDRFVIRGVMGPDEFHTGYPGAEEAGINNNAYTNIMAAWVLQRALDVLAVLPQRRRMELSETLGLRQEECSRWEELTRKIFVPFHDGVISQFEGYADLAELDWEHYRRRMATSNVWTESSSPKEGRLIPSRSPSRPTCSCSSICCPRTNCAHYSVGSGIG